MRNVRKGLLTWGFFAAALLPADGLAADRVVVDDWPKPRGEKGAPQGWTLKEYKGSVAPGDIAVESKDGRSVLHLKADKKSYFIGLENLDVSLAETPILTWRWKTEKLLEGADARKEETDDQPVNLYVTFRPDEEGDVRAIGYLWDVNAPRCSYISAPGERSWWKRRALRLAKVPTTWYIILRNGKTPLGAWLHESRDLAADYRKVFQRSTVPNVQSVAVQIDSATLKGRAESWVGPIRFTAAPGPAPPAAGSGEAACGDLNPAS
ncbi:MAG: DUF3047 domain-containing protein [Candidatus Tectomicrobia bacterium]|nr:DUF3047 domain-containing protein [Candidatus Tectomicrobia bacterium]